MSKKPAIELTSRVGTDSRDGGAPAGVAARGRALVQGGYRSDAPRNNTTKSKGAVHVLKASSFKRKRNLKRGRRG